MESVYTQLLAAPPWVLVLFTILGSTLLMLFLKRIIVGHLLRLADPTRFRFASLIANAMGLPLTIGILVVNLVILHRLLLGFEIATERSGEFIDAGAKVLIIVALLIFIDRLVSTSIRRYKESSDLLKNTDGIIKGISRGLIIGIGVLIILGTLGISITPIIASLGITSLAVALALQPTLENFFSGVQLVVDKPFRIDDYIELDSGEQGFVEKIGWRSTWIRMLPNNVVIMPNSMMSNSKVINYYYPTKELSVPVELGVHYKSDLDHVEKVALEEAHKILNDHEYGVETYEPFVLWHTFDNSSINFTVMLRAHEYFHRFFLKSAYIKALYKRFNREGIVIPYPIRAINLVQEEADLALGSGDS